MTKPKKKDTGRTERGQFAPGNPGKARGTRHKATRAVEELLEGEAQTLTRKAIEKAIEGDVQALRLCLERLAPVRKGRTFELPEFPPVRSAADVPVALSAILAAIARGEISTEEGDGMGALVSRYLNAYETAEIEKRLAALEERVGT